MEYYSVKMNLQEMIDRKGITKSKLSYRSEVSLAQINKFIKGEACRIDFATLGRLCTALDCEINELLTLEKQDKK